MSDSFTIIQRALIQAGIPQEEIRIEASLRGDLSVDSMELIEVITVIEEETGLSLDVRELKSAQTVAELIAIVDNYQNQRAR